MVSGSGADTEEDTRYEVTSEGQGIILLVLYACNEIMYLLAVSGGSDLRRLAYG